MSFDKDTKDKLIKLKDIGIKLLDNQKSTIDINIDERDISLIGSEAKAFACGLIVVLNILDFDN